MGLSRSLTLLESFTKMLRRYHKGVTLLLAIAMACKTCTSTTITRHSAIIENGLDGTQSRRQSALKVVARNGYFGYMRTEWLRSSYSFCFGVVMALERNLLRRSRLPHGISGTTPCKLLSATSSFSKFVKDEISVGNVEEILPPAISIYFSSDSMPIVVGIIPVKVVPIIKRRSDTVEERQGAALRCDSNFHFQSSEDITDQAFSDYQSRMEYSNHECLKLEHAESLSCRWENSFGVARDASPTFTYSSLSIFQFQLELLRRRWCHPA